MNMLQIEGKEVKLTNLEKLYWPELNLTKGDMINYYIKMGPYILPHLKNRPFSMKPYPDGIDGKSFYQKQCPKEAPDWLETFPINSSKKGYVDWCLINDLPSLIWIANRACIEMHTWFSRVPNLDKPDIAVLDIDPSGDTGFKESQIIAKLFKIIIDELKLTAIPKTSGATGIHIYIPIEPIYSFTQVREFLLKICRIVEEANPGLATTERNVKKRGSKVYLDAVQNASGKTIPAPYSLRPTPQATVSTPLLWKELEDDNLLPTKFTIENTISRLSQTGDLFRAVLNERQILPIV
ncbi:MAG: hypothetical protein APF76_13980 [Desulfitibacter sp. BRH_c19]|nr:MAG: hypothetical protein APF76_13980 [Desulfitibacter sp. BRH_c19]